MPTKTQNFHRAAFMMARYSISSPTLFRWVRSGKIPKPKYINGWRVWTDTQIEEADENLLSDSPEPTAANLELRHAKA